MQKFGKDDLVIEIGPGIGTLTNELLQVAGKVICIELDERMVKILKERFLVPYREPKLNASPLSFFALQDQNLNRAEQRAPRRFVR